ncbi:MAG TPA: hypothetical protein VJU86_15765 [Pyrinomonadaceae bacterium]|nr:hypothetical protein [Pyrinomonadaceae bacterium]
MYLWIWEDDREVRKRNQAIDLIAKGDSVQLSGNSLDITRLAGWEIP